MKTVILGIIQARMGSTRLPGKVLREVEGKPLLQHMLERVSKSKLVNKFIVATSLNEIDTEIKRLCDNMNVPCFRGSEDDVLDRFYQCAKSSQPAPEYIVRLTADCPLHDPKVVDFVVRRFLEEKVDYMTNSFPPSCEDGFDVEIFTCSALEEAWKSAKTKYEREHVTPFIKNSNRFKLYEQKYYSNYNYKLSVDDSADFELIKQIFAKLYIPNEMFGLKEVVSLIESNPSLLKIIKKINIR